MNDNLQGLRINCLPLDENYILYNLTIKIDKDIIDKTRVVLGHNDGGVVV